MAEPAPTQEPAQKLYKDEETGEMVSKTELKRRQKKAEQAKKKAEKASSAPLAPTASTSTEPQVNEEELNPNQYFEIRSNRIAELKASKNPIPYPHKFQTNTRIGDYVKKFEYLQSGNTEPNIEIRAGVRIMSIRSLSTSLRFYDCKAEGIEIQIFCDARNYPEGKEAFISRHDHFRRGDWIGVIGYPGRTNPKNRDVGELSIFAKDVILLTPCLHQLPSAHYGFHDQEKRYRQRYLDLIMNDSTRNIFQTRTKIIKYIRRFLDERNFLEVQTPMMNKLAGGASAKPFETYLHDLHMPLFLRVAPELYLKMLVVGGLERVYEIGRQFRNEGIDLTHNPEFTTVEFYSAFDDMYDLLDMTEEMISGLVKEVTGSYKTVLHKDGTEIEINWEKPWKRIPMIPTLEKAIGEKFPPADQLHTDETITWLEGVLKRLNIECPIKTPTKLIDTLVGELIEPTCINPSFIIGHPQVMSPLAKPDRNNPGLTERFEMFTAGKELCNAYTELNDPVIQRQLFEEQMRDKAKGDDEAQPVDETFIQALEYGLPPTAGWGFGIDRLVMFLTDKYNIKEVLAFPLMKDVDESRGPVPIIEGDKHDKALADATVNAPVAIGSNTK